MKLNIKFDLLSIISGGIDNARDILIDEILIEKEEKIENLLQPSLGSCSILAAQEDCNGGGKISCSRILAREAELQSAHRVGDWIMLPDKLVKLFK